MENSMKLIAILLLILPVFAFAHEDDHKVTNVTQVTNVYNSTYQDDGVASAIAMSQLHFDGSTHQLQLSIGAGHYNNESSLALGVAQKLGASGPLISGSVSRDSQHTGLGAGITIRF